MIGGLVKLNHEMSRQRFINYQNDFYYEKDLYTPLNDSDHCKGLKCSGK
jgi:hypothetical protein